MRPLLRYHGGKWRLAPWLISLMPPHRSYTETFGGGGSVLLRKAQCHTEVYNDLDGEIVNVFAQARDFGPQLQAMLLLTPFAREEYDLSWEPTDDKLERARRTIVRSFMGFSSASVTLMGNRGKTGFRAYTHAAGACGSRDWDNYAQQFEYFINRLRPVTIENRPAIQVMTAHDSPETLHYVDPPYMPETRDKGNDYRHEMTVQEHEQLLDFLLGVKGKVLLSGYPSDLYDTKLKGWNRKTRPVTTQGKAKRTEVVWMNYEDQAQGQLL
jgi:DNA adenine methylase